MTKLEMFQKGIQQHKQINISGLTAPQREGKIEFGCIVRQWVNEYQFTSVKKVVGAIKEQLRNANEELEIYTEYLAVETNKTYIKDLEESVEKWSMVVNCLSELLVSIQA